MGQKSIFLAIGLIIFTVILAVLFVISRLRSDSPDTIEPDLPTDESVIRNVVPAIDIVREPMVYDEYSLEVDDEISSWATNRSFLFTKTVGGGFGGGIRRSLLVVSDEPFQLPQDPNDNEVGLGEIARVTAIGKIEIMTEEQLETFLGVDFDDPNNELYNEELIEWEVGPVLMLSDISIDNSAR